ncbi:unnamed protein product [Agarophyton chilense]
MQGAKCSGSSKSDEERLRCPIGNKSARKKRKLKDPAPLCKIDESAVKMAESVSGTAEVVKESRGLKARLVESVSGTAEVVKESRGVKARLAESV